MKKLCKKGTVHPSPSPAVNSDDRFLSLLPVAILSLVAALSTEDREVLAYLISNSGDSNRLKKNNKTQNSGDHHHSPVFLCDCFSCYTSYWVRWDSSPNRKLIHEIIDAFEDSLETTKKKKKKERRKQKSARVNSDRPSRLSELSSSSSESVVGDSVEKDGGDCGEEAKVSSSSVGRVMSFIGQKFFGVWG